MSDLDQKIQQIEEQYGVEIERTVRPGMSDMYTISVEADGDHRGYTVEVAALEDIGAVNPAFAEHLGLTFSGDPESRTADLAALNRALVSKHGEYNEILQRSADEGHFNSPLHRIASVAAAARTGFEVDPSAFFVDPFFGGSGPGPNLVPLGSEGKIVSTIGVAHDSDWLIGAAFGKGPLAGLQDVESGVPSGLHGLNISQMITGFQEVPTRIADGIRNVLNGNTIRAYFGGELEWTETQLDRYEAQREEVPALQNVTNYDGTFNHNDWNVDVDWFGQDPNATRIAQFNNGGVDQVELVAQADAALETTLNDDADVTLFSAPKA